MTRLLKFLLAVGFVMVLPLEAHAVLSNTGNQMTETPVPPPAASASSAAAVAVAPAAKVTHAGPGTDIIKAFYAQIVETMKQGDQLGYAGRYKKLEPALKAAFNFPLMTRFSVGLDWSKATPAEQAQLTSAFTDFSIATYASQFKSYNGETFTILDEKPNAGGVMVETALTPPGKEPIPLNYLMKADEQGKLRIVDVFLDGAISELATRRAEFTSIVRRDGIAALVTSLGDKTKQLGPS